MRRISRSCEIEPGLARRALNAGAVGVVISLCIPNSPIFFTNTFLVHASVGVADAPPLALIDAATAFRRVPQRLF